MLGWNLILFAALAAPCPRPATLPLQIKAAITRNHPSFTEGLIFWENELYESVGLGGHSAVARINISTGESEEIVKLPPDQFGEGLALWRGELLQLTWKQGIVWRWPLAGNGIGLAASSSPYPREGWGISSGRVDGKIGLVASDGSDLLYFLDSNTFQTRRTVSVRDAHGAVRGINELEVVDGNVTASIWANVFPTYRLVRIDPVSGCVTGDIDLSPLKAQLKDADRAAMARDPDAVPNGIAYDPAASVLYLTLKMWPVFFKIALPR